MKAKGIKSASEDSEFVFIHPLSFRLYPFCSVLQRRIRHEYRRGEFLPGLRMAQGAL